MRALRTSLFLLPLALALPAGAEPEAGAAVEAPPSRQPPRLIEFVEARWPEGQPAQDAQVGLLLSIDAEGAVVAAEIAASAGEAFDAAAREAALQFRFEPARLDGKPFPARIRYVYEFRALEPKAAPAPEAAPEVAAATPADELVVTVEGQSAADRRRRSAEAVAVIETEQAKRQTADLGQVLARQEGVEVRRSGGLGSNARFSLGGLADEQVRFFLDGVPLELAGFPFGIANVPVNLVEQIEIYRGVVPVRYGADALGGAVNLVTAQRPYGTGGSLSLQGGAYDTWRFTAAGHHVHEPSGFLARAHLFADTTQNDYPVDVEANGASGGTERFTTDRFHDAYEAIGGAVDLGFVDLAWADRVLLRLHGAGFDKELQHDLTMRNAYGEATWGGTSWGAQLVSDHALSRDLQLSLVIGYADQRTHLNDTADRVYNWRGPTGQDRADGELGGDKRDQTTRQDAAFARVNLAWSLAEDHTLRLALAPTWAARTTEDPLLKDPAVAEALASDRTQLSLVTGLEYEIDLFDDALETIVFVKDYRYAADGMDVVRGRVAAQERTITRTGYGASTRLRLAEPLFLKASYELATRMPRPDEVFGDGGLIDPNLGLRPESSHNLNLGLSAYDVRTDAGSLRGGVNGFVRMADDFIALITVPPFSSYQNVASARSFGVELGAGWSAPGDVFHVDGNLTWQDFRNTSESGDFAADEGSRMLNRPWLFANASARVDLRNVAAAEDQLSPFWNTRYVGEFYRGWETRGDPSTKQVIEAQFVQSAGVSYRVPQGDATFGLTAELDNLTDAKTFDFYGVQRPGRAAYVKGTVEY